MNYYPVNLDIRNKRCLVVGGGRVALRKIKTLLKCGADVICVSKNFTEEILLLAKTEAKLTIVQKSYDASDVENIFLVIGATDKKELSEQIKADSVKNKAICNIADCPSLCDFILPAFVEQGDLTIAVSTSGASPAFAKKLKEDFENEFGEEYKIFLQLMKKIRGELLAEKHSPEEHKPLFEKLIKTDILSHIKNNEPAKIDESLKQVFGEKFCYKALMDEKK